MKKFIPLPRKFYEPSAEVVASQLLGHYLIRNTPMGHVAGNSGDRGLFNRRPGGPFICGANQSQPRYVGRRRI